MAALDEFLHVAEEEGQKQSADVRAINVGIGHENDVAVAQLGRIKIFLADAGAERGDHGADLFVTEHLVVARFLDVEDLSFQRQDGLETAVAALLGGAASGFALHQEQFAAFGLALGAIGELAGQAAAIERALAASEVAGSARRLASTRGFDGFVDDLASYRRILLEKRAQAFVDESLHKAGDIGVELAFVLAFELRLQQLHAYADEQTF